MDSSLPPYKTTIYVVRVHADAASQHPASWKKLCTMANRRSVVVVGDDTDLLVLLLHHLSPRHHVIFLQTASKILNIRMLQDHLAPDLTVSLLFLHAVTGCDTTSRSYGIGKVMAMSKCHQLKDHARLFMKPNQSHDDVNKHGEAALEILYKPGNSLEFERVARFSSKVASRSVYLPPESPHSPVMQPSITVTECTTKYSLQTWQGNHLDPTK